MRAIETRDADRTVLSDADREWATRAAAEVEGDNAPPDRFLARRAALALERVRAKQPAIDRVLRAVTWRAWIGGIVVLAALALGLASNRLAPDQRVNVLAFPLLGLLAWNLLVYASLLVRPLLAPLLRGRLRPMRALLVRLAQREPAPRAERGALANAVGTFANDWTRHSMPLAGARAARVLHWAAAAFAAGAVVGMYVRGLSLEYRAGWESTFLDAAHVQSLLAFALAPGAWLTGLPLPDAAHLEAIRFPDRPGEVAAPWIHLYAATAAAVVIVPRALLALASGWIERRRTARFPLPLDDPYFARLLRGYRRGAARVRVMPYSYQMSAQAVQGLNAVLSRALGTHAEIALSESTGYGDEERVGEVQGVDVLIAVFNLAATPEQENQSAFLAALARRAGPATALVVLVDASAFRRRFAQQPERIAERERAWRSALEGQRIEPVFVDLAAPDLQDAEGALLAVLDRAVEVER